jgi:CRISP-associated protein Cas1
VVGSPVAALQVKEVEKRGARAKVAQEVRLNEISQVNLFGNVHLTASALQGLCRGEIPTAWLGVKSGYWS